MTGRAWQARERVPAVAQALRGVGLWALLSSLAGAQFGVTVSDPGTVDKGPCLAGPWVAWTEDADVMQSAGTVVVRHLYTGVKEVVGPGFGSDMDCWFAVPGGAEPGVPSGPGDGLPSVRQTVRLAYLCLEADGTLDVKSATREGGGTWKVTTLAADLAWAGQVSVWREATAWAAWDGAGQTRVYVHDGQGAQVVSSTGQAFRPVLARSVDGMLTVAWDAYVGTPGQFAYEVFLSRLRRGQWLDPVNVSASPNSVDVHPSLAPAAEGGLWIAWSTDRGATSGYQRWRTAVVQRNADQVLLPAAYPASADPKDLGLVDLGVVRGTHRPVLRLDAAGRLWLFVNELRYDLPPFNKQHRGAVYTGGAWVDMGAVSDSPGGEIILDAQAAGGGMRVVYDIEQPTEMDVAVDTLFLGGPVEPLQLVAAGLLAQPSYPLDQPTLPAVPDLSAGGGTFSLVFADLHSHTGQSPDATGDLDQALFWARDQVGLHAWASTDHDQRGAQPYLDHEYELARRLLALYDSEAFTAYMGFEWTNDAFTCGPGGQQQITGHRAVFDSAHVYRYSTPPYGDLQEFYWALRVEGALGIPHHLSWFGGTTFQDGCFNAFVQPVSEIASKHGVFEETLVLKLRPKPEGDGKRFGVTAAGDDHTARPGLRGLAGIWVPASEPRRAAIKEALRARRCFGLARSGMGLDFRIQGAPMGSVIQPPAGRDLALDFEIMEYPAPPDQVQTIQVMVVDVADPGYLSAAKPFQAPYRFVPGKPAPVVKGSNVTLPAPSGPAIYMLRVTVGAGSDPDDTVLWSSPIWVDPVPAG